MIVAVANVPLGTLEMTQAELDENMSELSFLKEAVLCMINPEAYLKYDSLYDNPAEVKQWLYEMFASGEHNYNIEFINKIFNKGNNANDNSN